MKKKKLSLNKSVIAKLQEERMNKVFGGATETQNTCMAGCQDEQSIVQCELSDPCYNTFGEICHYK